MHDRSMQNNEAVVVGAAIPAAYAIKTKLFSAENAEQAFGKVISFIEGFNAKQGSKPTSEQSLIAVGIYQLSNAGLGLEKDGLQLKSSMHDMYGDRVSHVLIKRHEIPVAKEKKDLDAIRYEKTGAHS